MSIKQVDSTLRFKKIRNYFYYVALAKLDVRKD